MPSSNFSVLSYHVSWAAELWGYTLLTCCSVTSANYYYMHFLIIHYSHNILQRVITFAADEQW